MKIEQLRAQITAEKVNDKFAQIFGEKVNLNDFTTEQLSSTRDKVIGKLSQIQNALSFDSLNDSEDYQKQRMLLDLLDRAIEERQTNEGGDHWDIAQADAKQEVMDSSDDKEAIERIQANMFKDPKDHDQEYANKILNDMIDEIKEKGLEAMQHKFAQEDGPMEGNAFAQAVQKAKAAGMKKGDKFKVDGKEYTLQDCENLIDEMRKKKMKKMDEKSKPDYIDLDKDGNKTEPMKKAAKDKEKKKVKEGAEEEAQLVMAAKDMVDKVTGWMEDTASMQTETILELGDAIRDEEGSEKSESFINAVKPALESLYTSLEATREALTGGVAVLTGEGAPTDTMGADAEEPAMEPTDDADTDMPDQSDDFAASEPATGGEEPADREKRESFIRLSRRLAETLSTQSKKKA